MPYIRLIDGQPEWVTKNDIRLENPGTSFPVHMGPNEMAAWGCIPVRVLDEPDVSKDQVATLDALPTLQGDEWVQGWTVSGKTPASMDEDRTLAKRAVLRWIEGFLAPYTSDTVSVEPLSWNAKAAAARAWLDGDPHEHIPALQAEIEASGETMQALCDAIIAKSEKYRLIIGFTTGLRRKTMAEIDAATPDGFEAIQSNAMTVAMAKAEEINAL